MTNRAKELRRKRRRKRKVRKSRLVYVVNYGGRLRETFHTRMSCRSLMPSGPEPTSIRRRILARERQWAIDAGMHPCSLCADSRTHCLAARARWEGQGDMPKHWPDPEIEARKFVLGKLRQYIDRLTRDTRARWVHVQSADSVSSGGKLCTIIVCLDKARTHRRLWFDDKQFRWRWDGRRSRHRGETTRTPTGRTSTSVPNPHNVPVQRTLSFGICHAFVPWDVRRMTLSADYTMVERRLSD